MAEQEKAVNVQIIEMYKEYLSINRSEYLKIWPIINGHDVCYATFKGWHIFILKHTGNSSMLVSNKLGEINEELVGVDEIRVDNINKVRDRLIKFFNVRQEDGIFFISESKMNIDEDLRFNKQRHEVYMGLVPMKIFLSHKGADKSKVRDYKTTLAELGFNPWLDEDAMPAGTHLERGILQGFKDSCAAVFFITPNFKDEKYLASEVDYAIQEKRLRGDNFAIITIVFSNPDNKCTVPELLKPYVWKEPLSDLEALREIIRALPIKVGEIRSK